MNLKIPLLFFILVFFVVTPFSGCLDVLDSLLSNQTIIYEANPTSVHYVISYGYTVNSSGDGSTTILCTLDLPDPLSGSVKNISFRPIDVIQRTLANNLMVEWNYTHNEEISLSFEVQAQVIVDDYMVEDLNGENALSIEEIRYIFPDIVERYCNKQSLNETHFIDPTHPDIRSIASTVKAKVPSNNSFLVGKELFIWLKNQTTYKIHDVQTEVQPSAVTLATRQGDCDDLSFLYISLCRSVGIPARFIRGYLLDSRSHPIRPIDHMWVEIYVGGGIGKNGWIPVECAGTGNTGGEVHQNYGLEDAFHLRLFTDDGTNESLEISSSHISVRYEQGNIIDIQGFSTITQYELIQTQKLCIKEGSKRSYC
ncbi:MAG: transglutaminase domain-containing protein [Candidatus Thermoplasmatota archaeon]|nr:transglutaminase domain-containing protein [Candidatus Thermoplasmatota archaeon]